MNGTPDRPDDAHSDASGDPARTRAPGRDRRTFLRHLSGDAIVTAGKLAGASAVLRRSLAAAGQAAVGHVEGAALASGQASDAAETPVSPAARVSDAEPADRATLATPATVHLPDPVAALTADQQAFLRTCPNAVLAVNDPGGHPLVASMIFHWDGTRFRVPGRDSTARVANIDRDPRVSLLIDDPSAGTWVAVTGVASLVYGDQVEADIRLILSKYFDEAEAARRWDEMRATGDQMAIHVRPTRFVWRGP